MQLYFFDIRGGNFFVAAPISHRSSFRYLVHACVVHCLTVQQALVAILPPEDRAIKPEVLTIPEQASRERVCSLRVFMLLVLAALVPLECYCDEGIQAEHL